MWQHSILHCQNNIDQYSKSNHLGQRPTQTHAHQLGPKSTWTQILSDPDQIKPKSTRTLTNSDVTQLRPKPSRTQTKSNPNQLGPHQLRTITQLRPRPTRTLINSDTNKLLPNNLRPKQPRKHITSVSNILKHSRSQTFSELDQLLARPCTHSAPETEDHLYKDTKLLN